MQKIQRRGIVFPLALPGDTPETLFPKEKTQSRHARFAVKNLIRLRVELLVKSPAHRRQQQTRHSGGHQPLPAENAAPVAGHEQLRAQGEGRHDQPDGPFGQHREACEEAGAQELIPTVELLIFSELPHGAGRHAEQQSVGAHVVEDDDQAQCGGQDKGCVPRRFPRIKQFCKTVKAVHTRGGAEQGGQFVRPVGQSEQQKGKRRTPEQQRRLVEVIGVSVMHLKPGAVLYHFHGNGAVLGRVHVHQVEKKAARDHAEQPEAEPCPGVPKPGSSLHRGQKSEKNKPQRRQGAKSSRILCAFAPLRFTFYNHFPPLSHAPGRPHLL